MAGVAGVRTVVVGASSGIGRAIGEEFVRQGAPVAFAARSLDRLETITSDLDGEAIPVECTVRDTSSVEGMVEQCVEAFGGLDTVINSAGILHRGPLIEKSDTEIEAVLDTNLMGAIRVTRATLPELIESGGSLVHISSEAGERGVSGLVEYCASKGGLNSLVEATAVEYSEHGVTVNAIAPGTTKTSMNEEVRSRDPEWERERADGIPLGRLGTPADIVGLATYLASDSASFVTGEIIAVDGGSTAQ